MEHAVKLPAGRILPIVVLLAAALATGCVDRDALKKMQDQLNYLESSERRNRREMDQIDSLLTESINTNRELRADVYTALDEFRAELAATREGIAELGDKIDRRGTEHPVVVYPGRVEPDTLGAGAADTQSHVAGEPIVVDCGKLYDQGMDDLRNGNYDLAIEAFQEFLRTCSSSPDMPRALYWLGQSYYTNDDFAAAIEVFLQAIDNYSGDSGFDLMPSALLMLGRCYQKSDQPRHAKSYYERLIQEYPDKPEANIAESRLQAMETEEGG